MPDTSESQANLGLIDILQNLNDREIYLIIGIVQGFAAYALVENVDWLADRRHLQLSLWMIVLVWPPIFLLSYARAHIKRALVYVSGFSLCLALLALHTGWQAMPSDEYHSYGLVAGFIISMLVAIFVALIHLQPRVSNADASYEVFFTLSWRNFLTVAFSLALMLGVRLVLFLWESLFAAIGVDFFQELFGLGWFMGPVLGASFAFGLYSFRAATSVIDSAASLLARLIWLLLPILLLLIATFLATLPFVGLEPLWDTDRGTSILMAANLLALFFVNAVYQTGERLPYPRWPHSALMIGVALLPVVSALACYGLLLRVGQYGWSIDRLWAMLVVVLMACFSLGYAYIILRTRTDWQARLPDINRTMSWVVLVSLLLTASPVLDFRLISAWNHFSRYESGAIERIDLEYVRTRLGKPGHARLEALQAKEPDILERLKPEQDLAQGYTQEEIESIVTRPDAFDIPDALSVVVRQRDSSPPKMLLRLHLNDDDQYEYVAIWGHTGFLYAFCWTLVSDEWQNCGYPTLTGDEETSSFDEWHDAEIEPVTPARPYKDVRIGDHQLEFR